jgi:hypothetical protein
MGKTEMDVLKGTPHGLGIGDPAEDNLPEHHIQLETLNYADVDVTPEEAMGKQIEPIHTPLGISVVGLSLLIIPLAAFVSYICIHKEGGILWISYVRAFSLLFLHNSFIHSQFLSLHSFLSPSLSLPLSLSLYLSSNVYYFTLSFSLHLLLSIWYD